MRLQKEEYQGLQRRYDDENDLNGAVVCTLARIATGCDCVQHDLRAILEQNVGKVEFPLVPEELFPSGAEEYDLEEPRHRAQRTEG